MFAVDCSAHGHEVLLSTRRIDRLATTEAGLEVHWRCWCGHRGVLVTGRRADTGARRGGPVEAPGPVPRAEVPA